MCYQPWPMAIDSVIDSLYHKSTIKLQNGIHLKDFLDILETVSTVSSLKYCNLLLSLEGSKALKGALKLAIHEIEAYSVLYM